MHFPTCQVVENKSRSKSKSEAEAERQPREVSEDEGNKNGLGERVTEVIVRNIFHPYFRKKKNTLNILI